MIDHGLRSEMVTAAPPRLHWHIREAGSEDAERLALVGGATFLETFAGLLEGGAIVDHCAQAHSAAAYRDHLAAGAAAWLAETCEGGAPIGYALLAGADLPGMAGDGSDLELKRIYALSRFHGSGLGQALMQCAVDAASARGAGRLLLGVYAGNARAMAFYRKHGFVEIASRRFRVGNRDYDDTVFARPLG